LQTSQLKILIIGSGAREHAIAKALHRSPHSPQIFCIGTSKNPGIEKLTTNYLTGDICDTEFVTNAALTWTIDLAIIGPEAPLEKGLADLLWKNNIPTIGPKKNLAQIETSKKFTRDLLKNYEIPGSPVYQTFNTYEGVESFLRRLGDGNYVIKADGLMGGKGVKVAGDHLHSLREAFTYCQELLGLQQTFVIEEKLIGQEFSLLYFCDGNVLIPMPLIQDHKRAFINDEGPNTGGMGSYSDANHSLPFVTEKDLNEAHKINNAMLSALTKEYREKYIGIIYSSFMTTRDGVRLIEYNARFGDPEAMNALAILETDFVEICQAMVTGHLATLPIHFKPLATVCKYSVPEGYPDQPLKNEIIDISSIKNEDELYFGAVEKRNGQLYATGSRAVAVLGVAPTIFDAEKIAETEINKIHGKIFHRSDIGTEHLIAKRIREMQELRQ